MKKEKNTNSQDEFFEELKERHERFFGLSYETEEDNEHLSDLAYETEVDNEFLSEPGYTEEDISPILSYKDQLNLANWTWIIISIILGVAVTFVLVSIFQ